jgi:hypothetical protein
MVQATVSTALQVQVTQHTVRERRFVFTFPEGVAEVDQTDYGHPGRFNPCHAGKMPLKLQPKTQQIVAAAEALAALLP